MSVHYHHCPGCYDRPACTMNCTIEPELSDHRDFGFHSLCDDCEKRERDECERHMSALDLMNAALDALSRDDMDEAKRLNALAGEQLRSSE